MSEWEDHANFVIEDAIDMLDFSKLFIKKEHDFYAQLQALGYVKFHLDSSSDDSVLTLADNIQMKLLEAIAIVEEHELQELHLIREEEHIIRKLKKHIDFRAVRKLQDDEKEIIRLEIEELQKIHEIFVELVALFKKEHLESEMKHYVVHLYKIFKSYENVFNKILKKEQAYLV